MVLETFPPISELATHSIDQEVVDGLVDGVERRIPVGQLLRLSAVVEELPRSVFFGFCQALTDEERYVDRVRNMYGFKPVISPESTVKASLIAIVGGTALCSETERSEALGLMEYLTQTLYNVNTKPSSILSIREVSGTLKSGGFTNLSYQEFGAFLGFMQQDPRFYAIGDGRIVLTETFAGDPEQLVEIPRTEDLTSAINQALPFLYTDPHGVFTEGVLLGTLKSLGFCLRTDQLQEAYEKLRLSPYVRPLNDGRYKLLKDELDGSGMKTGGEQQFSLESRIKAVRGESQRKPHSRRGTGHKRTVNM